MKKVERNVNHLQINVALARHGARVIASSEFTVGCLASKVIDGVVMTSGCGRLDMWRSEQGIPHPHWVWLKFAGPAEIDRVRIWKVPAYGAGTGARYPVDFLGQHSPDRGETFQDLFAVLGNSIPEQERYSEHSFQPVVIDNFRLFITKSASSDNPFTTEISEIEVLGRPLRCEDYPALGPGMVFDPGVPTREAPVRGEDLVVCDREREVVFASTVFRIGFDKRRPGLTQLAWSSLGECQVEDNLLIQRERPAARPYLETLWCRSQELQLDSHAERDGNRISYREVNMGEGVTYTLSFENMADGFRLRVRQRCTNSLRAVGSGALRIRFDASLAPVAVLANLDRPCIARLPLLIHAPGRGSLRVTAGDGTVTPRLRVKGHLLDRELIVDILGGEKVKEDGTLWLEKGEYQWEVEFRVTEIFPDREEILNAPHLLRGLRKGWLNGFAFRADIGVLANNSISDNCAFYLHEIADMALFTPPLAPGLTALDLIRQTLNRYLAGAPAYRQVSWLDSGASLIISAWDYVTGSGDISWLGKQSEHLDAIGREILSMDSDGDGLMEAKQSGNSGTRSWSTNWWDEISFGHKDAYSNALIYRALGCMADLQEALENSGQGKSYRDVAQRLRATYLRTFFNPDTGVLAGWRSLDGQLHDYYFTFVNGIAIAYGLVDHDIGNSIMDRMQAKLREVGYESFALGLPGNLVPILRRDYCTGGMGTPTTEDGSDTFQTYENGGATACMSYHYIRALYSLGRRKEAEEILFAMLKTYGDGGFSTGVGSGVEFKTWKGHACGYEGLLADAYYPLLAVMTGYLGLPMPPLARKP